MRRMICLLLILCLLLPAAMAEGSLTLNAASTVDEVNTFIDLPDETSVPAATLGRIRFVSLNDQDPAFRLDFWQNDQYNLTQKGSYRADFRHMHDRAAYCMALSYLGVDMTPAMMSTLAGSRDVTAPYDEITAQLDQIERVEFKAYHFNTAVENYKTDSAYSPVFIKVRRPDGGLHTVLIVGYIPSTRGFIICDPAAPAKDGENLHAYKMAWHVERRTVLASDFWDLFYGSQVVEIFQWKRVNE